MKRYQNYLRLFLIVMLTSSCAVLDGLRLSGQRMSGPSELFELSTQDYIDHLAFLSHGYLATQGAQVKRLSRRSHQYLRQLHHQIVSNNELLLDQKIEPRFYIIKSSLPFLFSLPRGQFFFSTEILTRYLQNEEVLVAAFTHEVIRSHRNIYEKKMIIPTGYMTTERLLSLVRIPVDIRLEVSKLSYHVIGRSGFDGTVMLNWLQLLNKNSLAFATQLGDPRLISREEFLFKNFLVTDNQAELDPFGSERRSDPGYYALMNEIREIL